MKKLPPIVVGTYDDWILGRYGFHKYLSCIKSFYTIRSFCKNTMIMIFIVWRKILISISPTVHFFFFVAFSMKTFHFWLMIWKHRTRKNISFFSCTGRRESISSSMHDVKEFHTILTVHIVCFVSSFSSFLNKEEPRLHVYFFSYERLRK